MLLFVSVNDMLCATNDEQIKMALFKELESEYGLEDQGLKTQYLCVETMHDENGIFVRQQKDSKAVVNKDGLGSQTRKADNPVDVTAHLTSANESDGQVNATDGGFSLETRSNRSCNRLRVRSQT